MRNLRQKPRYVYANEPLHLRDFANLNNAPPLQCGRCRRILPEHQFRLICFAGDDVGALHPFCNTCREQRRGAWINHPLYSIELDNYWRKAAHSLKQGARARNIVVGIDKDDLIGLHIKQRGRCSLTGLPMNYKKKEGSKNHAAPSCDRIDSRGNYVLGNIQIVLRIVNIMKTDLPQDMFLELCERISAHKISAATAA